MENENMKKEIDKWFDDFGEAPPDDKVARVTMIRKANKEYERLQKAYGRKAVRVYAEQKLDEQDAIRKNKYVNN